VHQVRCAQARVAGLTLSEPDAALVLSDTILDEGLEACRRVRRRLEVLGVPGEVVLTGAASVPGALTKGDLDLHLRVQPESFAAAVDSLSAVYRPTSLSAWAATLAVFDVPSARPTGLAVTPVGSEHDVRFRRAWLLLREDPALLEEYNDLKRASFGNASYEERKSAFFTRIVTGGGDACASR
jgi:GrpB-like predicted nucleotidyltransferase (UPF0157 family)